LATRFSYFFILIVRPYRSLSLRLAPACAPYDPINRSAPEPAAQTWHGPFPSQFAHIKIAFVVFRQGSFWPHNSQKGVVQRTQECVKSFGGPYHRNVENQNIEKTISLSFPNCGRPSRRQGAPILVRPPADELARGKAPEAVDFFVKRARQLLQERLQFFV